MPHTTCLTLQASHYMPHTTCLTLQASHYMPHTTGRTLHDSHYMPHTTGLTLHASHYLPHTTGLTLHASHYMPHTNGKPTPTLTRGTRGPTGPPTLSWGHLAALGITATHKGKIKTSVQCVKSVEYRKCRDFNLQCIKCV